MNIPYDVTLLQADEEAQVLQRYSTISSAVMAEINHFHESRNTDFNNMMRTFLTSQLDFHKNVSIAGPIQSFDVILDMICGSIWVYMFIVSDWHLSQVVQKLEHALSQYPDPSTM